jgi:glycosyltransferase involved in cell wall biosynthesis
MSQYYGMRSHLLTPQWDDGLMLDGAPLVRDPLRLLFVGTLPEPGGAAAHFVSLTTAMASAGHQVSVVAAPGSGIWRALEQNSNVALHAATFTRTFEKSAMNVVRQVVRTFHPDRVIGVFERDYWGTALVAAQCGVPLDLFLHHAGMKRSNRYFLPWLRRRFLLPSDDLRRWLVARGFPARRTDVLYNPVDTTFFRPDPALREATRQELGIAPDAVLVGYVGRIESNKGIIPFAHAMNKAMERVPNMHALWVGFGRREAELDAIINSAPSALQHVRRPWTDNMLPYYSAMDMLVLPSTGREAFGRVLVEAQACGIPVLGSNIGGIAETMNVGVTGRLVEPGDVKAWTDALVCLASDPALRACMGAAGREYAKSEFDSSVIARAFEQLLKPAPTH